MLFLMQIMTHVWHFVIKFVNVNGSKLMVTTCSVTTLRQLVATYSTHYFCTHLLWSTHASRASNCKTCLTKLILGFFHTLSSAFMFAKIPSVAICLHINGIIRASHVLSCHLCCCPWWSFSLILRWNLTNLMKQQHNEDFAALLQRIASQRVMNLLKTLLIFP